MRFSASAAAGSRRGGFVAQGLPPRIKAPHFVGRARLQNTGKRWIQPSKGPEPGRGSLICNASSDFKPPAPSPDLTADQVVKAQLDALQERDSKGLLMFATEEARTNGVFSDGAQSSCNFRMLHGHIRSEVIGAIQKEPSQYEIWVRVWGMEVLDLTRVPATSTAVFIWKLSRELMLDEASSPSHHGTGCWLTHQIQRESVEPDPRLRWAGILP